MDEKRLKEIEEAFTDRGFAQSTNAPIIRELIAGIRRLQVKVDVLEDAVVEWRSRAAEAGWFDGGV